MKFTIERSHLLKPLQQVSGTVGGRATLPILSNILLSVQDHTLQLTATDLEVELIGRVNLEGDFESGQVTVPARKFLDICRGLPDEGVIHIHLDGDRLHIQSGRSRFSLATLPANDFPNIEDWQSELSITLMQSELKGLIEKTQFSMANQDVRYYMNGMLFDIEDDVLRAVATDGHRMSIAKTSLASSYAAQQIIVPRKGILELSKLLDAPEESVILQIGSSNIRVEVNHFIFTSKLIDGRFPDYRRVLPQQVTRTLVAPCDVLRQSFSRVAILSNEKFRGIRLNIDGVEMRVMANNPEQEEAEEIVEVQYEGEAIEIGFNVNYVLDVLNTIKTDDVQISMSDANASTLIEHLDDESAMYVVMPIRL